MTAGPDPRHRCGVLVVDDDRELQDLLCIALGADGYAVDTASTGRDALSHLRSTADTCVILLDLGMPGMDGVRFRAAQLRDRSLAWIPVVVLSGAVDAAIHARELGAQAFVAKPLDLDHLRRVLGGLECCRARPRHDQRQ